MSADYIRHWIIIGKRESVTLLLCEMVILGAESRKSKRARSHELVRLDLSLLPLWQVAQVVSSCSFRCARINNRKFKA